MSRRSNVAEAAWSFLHRFDCACLCTARKNAGSVGAPVSLDMLGNQNLCRVCLCHVTFFIRRSSAAPFPTNLQQTVRLRRMRLTTKMYNKTRRDCDSLLKSRGSWKKEEFRAAATPARNYTSARDGTARKRN